MSAFRRQRERGSCCVLHLNRSLIPSLPHLQIWNFNIFFSQPVDILAIAGFVSPPSESLSESEFKNLAIGFFELHLRAQDNFNLQVSALFLGRWGCWFRVFGAAVHAAERPKRVHKVQSIGRSTCAIITNEHRLLGLPNPTTYGA